MIRFIVKKSFRYVSGVEGQEFYTIDQDVKELENCLTKGGHGIEEYERHELIGVEVIPE